MGEGSGRGVARGRGATAGVVSVGGEAAVRRLRGGVKLAGIRGGSVAAFCGVGARRRRKEERNSLLGLLWCSCARQRGFWGSARGYPQRRRGGGRLGCSGRGGVRGTARGAPARAKESGEEHQRDVWRLAGRRWRGEQLSTAGGRRSAQRRRGKQRKELEEGEKGCFAISENSRDQTVEQR